MTKKLLFFTSRLPLNPLSGREMSLYYYIKYLHEMYEYDIIVVTFDEKTEVVDSPNEYIRTLYKIKAPGKKALLSNFFSMVFVKRMPLQVALYYSADTKEAVDKIVSRENPDIVMADMVRTSEYLKDFKGKKIFDMDDMLSVRYGRQLESKGGIINPFGAYANKLPSFVSKILDNNFIKRKILQYECNALSNYEMKISKSYNAVVLVSDRERDRLNAKLNEQKAVTVSTGVNCDYFSKVDVKVKENLISFLGVYSAPHNEDAVLYFYNSIFPIIKKENPDIVLRLVGGNVTDSIKRLKNDKAVNIEGRVEDVRRYIKESRVFIAPLRFGSGIKTKILEAMAMGVPVVTTSIGAEGMDAENYKDMIIEDDEEKFAEAVLRLISDKELYNKICSNGKEFVRNNYDWNIKMKSWNEVFNLINKG
ncbi:glycosyl transferase [Clostridium acetobutylicum]|nr:glycosyl transferase [Clostridium acetobutylicum]